MTLVTIIWNFWAFLCALAAVLLIGKHGEFVSYIFHKFSYNLRIFEIYFNNYAVKNLILRSLYERFVT